MLSKSMWFWLWLLFCWCQNNEIEIEIWDDDLYKKKLKKYISTLIYVNEEEGIDTNGNKAINSLWDNDKSMYRIII